MHKLAIDRQWTLFLDRDGVINRRIPDGYINEIRDFEFLPKVLPTLAQLSKLFGYIIVVTNQQGIGKGILTEKQLTHIHQFMMQKVVEAGGCIDSVYYCGDLAGQNNNCRKPSPTLAYRAKQDYPGIDFNKSVVVGDAISDVAFGQNLGMKTILIGEQLGYPDPDQKYEPDFILPDLPSVSSILKLNHG